MNQSRINEEGDTLPTPTTAPRTSVVAQRAGHRFSVTRAIPEETAIAITHNGSTHAVMMATPDDLEDFAIGFTLTEGLIEKADEIDSIEPIVTPLGIELRIWLPDVRAKAYAARRRSMAGPTGCGLCGIESLEQAVRPAPRIARPLAVRPDWIGDAMASLADAQLLHAETRATHAAGFWTPGEGLQALREDVGRHNALDKLAGALLRRKIEAKTGLILMTSRVSIELVQKAARLGASALAAISAPTAAALRMAEASGLMLICVARGRDFQVYTFPDRLIEEAMPDVA